MNKTAFELGIIAGMDKQAFINTAINTGITQYAKQSPMTMQQAQETAAGNKGFLNTVKNFAGDTFIPGHQAYRQGKQQAALNTLSQPQQQPQGGFPASPQQPQPTLPGAPMTPPA